MIREKSDQPFQGIEKAIFYRICRLLTLHIQLLFVFDGPSRPWKKGRPAGKIDYEKRRILQETLRALKIPYHEAPAEAEAECARLQQLGVVDAVFSQDSDSLMFGCDFLIRDDRVVKQAGTTDRSKENTAKSQKTVRVVKGEDIRLSHGLDRDGLVLFAMLSGGDYNTTGLRGCGDAASMLAVKAGLGRSLCQCRTQADCRLWREDLVELFRRKRRPIDVPPDFPDYKTLKKYNEPRVSTDDELLNLRALRHGWDRTIDEVQLLEVTSSRYNIWGRLYMNWIGPILLTRYLASTPLPQGIPTTLENPHLIRMTKRRVQVDKPLERKLTFSPFGLTTLTRAHFEGERKGYWGGTLDLNFDPDHRVESEIPDYLLQRPLHPDILNPPTSTRKRKIQDTEQAESPTPTPSTKKQRKGKQRATSNSATPISGRNLASRLQIVELSDPDEESDSDAALFTPLNLKLPVPTLNLPEGSRSNRPSLSANVGTNVSRSSAIELLDDEDDDDADLKEAIRLSLQDYGPEPTEKAGPQPSGSKRRSAKKLGNIPNYSSASNHVESEPARIRTDSIRTSNIPSHLSTPKSKVLESSPLMALMAYSTVRSPETPSPHIDTPSKQALPPSGNHAPKQQRVPTPAKGTFPSQSSTPGREQASPCIVAATPQTIEELRAARVRVLVSRSSNSIKEPAIHTERSRTEVRKNTRPIADDVIDLTSD